MAEPVVCRAGAEVLDELRPLWLAMRDHHGAVAPHRGPVQDDATSWGRRRAQYERWLADEGAFVLLARDGAGGPALGYAMVRPEAVQTTTWPDVRLLDVESLSIAPAARGRGIGGALMARVREIADAEGYGKIQLTVVAENADALRFYAREGFTPAYVVLQDTRRRP